MRFALRELNPHVTLCLRTPTATEMFSFSPYPTSIFRLLPRLWAGIALLFSLASSGAELPTVPEPPVERVEIIDAPRDFLSEKFVRLAARIDRFFGDDRNFQENNDSVFQLDLTKGSGYGNDNKFEISGRARLRLPSTEGRFHMMLESDPDKNLSGEPTKSPASSGNKTGTPVGSLVAPGGGVNAPKSYSASLRYEKKQVTALHYSTDTGIQFSGITTDPNPFARARGSYTLPLGKWQAKATETLFWFYTIGAGESTQLDLERVISAPLIFRATSTATWLFEKQNYDLRQDFSVYHTLSDRAALLYQASAIGVTHPHFQVSDYVLLMSYRYRVHRDWIFFDISPQLHYPKEKNYQVSPAINLRLEMLFDKSE